MKAINNQSIINPLNPLEYAYSNINTLISAQVSINIESKVDSVIWNELDHIMMEDIISSVISNQV